MGAKHLGDLRVVAVSTRPRGPSTGGREGRPRPTTHLCQPAATMCGVRVRVRVKPGAARPVVGGSHGYAGDLALVVAVTARAVDGAATEAVLRAVAEAFGVRSHER